MDLGRMFPRWPRRDVAVDGTVRAGFEPVAGALARQLRGQPGGAAICVYHRGECVVDLWGGSRDGRGQPWLRDTMAPSFSTTKGVASTLLHIAADRGLLDYDDRVAEHWPEFARAGKESITIRQVLTHQAGLYHIRRMVDRAERMLDWGYMIRALEHAAPTHPPGERTGYHGLTYGFIVGELLQRVTGKPFSALVQEEIARPLGLDGMYIGAPDEVLHRAARLVWPKTGILPRAWFAPALGEIAAGGAAGLRRLLSMVSVDLDLGSIFDALTPRGISSFDFASHATLRATIPAANGLFTARSLARMYAALAAGGEIDGKRILSRRTLERATEVQRSPGRRAVLPFEMRWRLGYHGVATTRGIPRNAFGHFGFGGSGAWADPSRDLAVALIVNSGLGTPFGDLRIARISGAVLRCVGRGSREVLRRAVRPQVRTSSARLRSAG